MAVRTGRICLFCDAKSPTFLVVFEVDLGLKDTRELANPYQISVENDTARYLIRVMSLIVIFVPFSTGGRREIGEEGRLLSTRPRITMLPGTMGGSLHRPEIWRSCWLWG